MTIQVEGYFGGDRGKSVPGRAVLTVSGSGRNETLTVEYVGEYRVMVAVRTIEQLAADTRREVARSGKAAERALQLEGYYTDNGKSHRPGKTSAWFWTDGAFEMLSLEYGGRGQISIPFKPVMALLRSSRRGLV